uniref:PUM-HD domain-containing protein n=1 Tax=Globodera rostochiensis TaxID=31243 RepID=A0A914IFS8_GLORO
MINRFIRNFLNGQHIIDKFRHVQTVRLTFLHQYIKNVCPAAVLSCGVRMASSSSSSNRPSHRSKLLADIYKNRTANLQLTNLGKDVVEFAQDSQGSRFIKQKLERANPTEKAQLVDALRGHVVTLAMHKSGNHVIRTALETIINEILAQVLPLSLHEYGNWVIRRVLEHCTEQQKRHVLEQLHGNVLSLVTDQYGNYVIEHVIEHGTEQQKRPVLEQLLDNVPTLLTDQYGNHVIQHVIEHGLPEDRERIVRSLQGDIMKYAQDKFGCLVILKCLICGTADQKKALIDNVCVGGPKTLRNARQLMADEFGTFVIQKFFEYGTDDQKAQLVDALRGHVLELALQMYGGPVIQAALKSILEELTPRSCVIKCIKDHYGSYVMNMIFELIEPQRLQFVVDAITNSPSDSVASLSVHQYASRVIECVLEHCTEQQKRPVLEQLHGNVSKLLEKNRTDNLQFADWSKHVVELAHDPRGSKFIQQKLECANSTEKAQLVDALRGHMVALALHKIGNHVIRTALETIITEILAQVIPLSLHEYGNWVIRRLLEHCTEQQKRHVLEQLHGNVSTLVTDKHGSFVIRHVIEHGTEQQKRPVLEQLLENVSTLVTDKYGSYVIRVVIEHCTEQQKRPMLEQLLENVSTLVTDKYGSFVIRHVIEHGRPEDRERIVRNLQGNIMKNTHLHSFCSIIEKCLIFGTTEQKNALIDQVCADNGSGKPALLEMMKRPFAKDVVQKMLNVADSARHQKMMFVINTAPIKNTKKRSANLSVLFLFCSDLENRTGTGTEQAKLEQQNTAHHYTTKADAYRLPKGRTAQSPTKKGRSRKTDNGRASVPFDD